MFEMANLAYIERKFKGNYLIEMRYSRKQGQTQYLLIFFFTKIKSQIW